MTDASTVFKSTLFVSPLQLSFAPCNFFIKPFSYLIPLAYSARCSRCVTVLFFWLTWQGQLGYLLAWCHCILHLLSLWFQYNTLSHLNYSCSWSNGVDLAWICLRFRWSFYLNVHPAIALCVQLCKRFATLAHSVVNRVTFVQTVQPQGIAAGNKAIRVWERNTKETKSTKKGKKAPS